MRTATLPVRACACGASAWGLPPGCCYLHALDDERERATRALVLARQGIEQACRLAARHPHNAAIQQEARAWLVEAHDDATSATAILAALPPVMGVRVEKRQALDSRPSRG